jgi:hypothetical protein
MSRLEELKRKWALSKVDDPSLSISDYLWHARYDIKWLVERIEELESVSHASQKEKHTSDV